MTILFGDYFSIPYAYKVLQTRFDTMVDLESLLTGDKLRGGDRISCQLVENPIEKTLLQKVCIR